MTLVPRRGEDSIPFRATRARVDVDRIVSNLAAIRKRVARAQVMPVVKANAYGHGAPTVALALERAGADGLCVALLEEGVELRRCSVACPILLIGPLAPGQIGPAIDERLTPTVYRPDLLEPVEAAGRRLGRPAGFQLKLDTGMSRLGVSARDLPALIDRIALSRYTRLEGVYSSLACADQPENPMNARQVALFEESLAALSARGISAGVRHLANSAAIAFLPKTVYDAVRPGILIYGVPPSTGFDDTLVHPALSLHSEVVQARDVPAGAAVGYAATFRAEAPRRLATIPAGYDDGLMRSLSNRGCVLVNGRRAPLAGRISMDLAVADVTGCGDVRPGDEVVLIGAQGSEQLTAWEVSESAGTIPWELLCRIGGRVPRDYYEGGKITGRWSRWQRS